MKPESMCEERMRSWSVWARPFGRPTPQTRGKLAHLGKHQHSTVPNLGHRCWVFKSQIKHPLYIPTPLRGDCAPSAQGLLERWTFSQEWIPHRERIRSFLGEPILQLSFMRYFWLIWETTLSGTNLVKSWTFISFSFALYWVWWIKENILLEKAPLNFWEVKSLCVGGAVLLFYFIHY